MFVPVSSRRAALALVLALLTLAARSGVQALVPAYNTSVVELTAPGLPEYSHAGHAVACTATADAVFVGVPDITASTGSLAIMNHATHGGDYLLTRTIPGPGVNSSFASSIAVSGTSLVVCAPQYNACYLYDTSEPAGSATPIGSGSAGSEYGYVVAINAAGDLIAVGAPGEGNGVGAVYVVHYTGGTWANVANIASPASDEHQRFGEAVALTATNDLIVGQPGAGYGAAYHYRNLGANQYDLGELISLGSASGVSDSGFGASISTAGSVLAIGAPGHGINNAGAVKLYTSSGTSWLYQHQLELPSSSAASTDAFGTSVSVDPTTSLSIAVGAPGRTSGDERGAGLVYVFHLDCPSCYPSLVSTVSSDTPEEGDALGTAVALCDGTLIAGAPLAQVVGQAEAGLAVVASRTGCPVNQEPVDNDCQACPAGTNSLLGAACSCPNGEYLDGASCTACANTDTTIPGHEVTGCVCDAGLRNDGVSGCVTCDMCDDARGCTPAASCSSSWWLVPVLIGGGAVVGVALIGAGVFALRQRSQPAATAASAAPAAALMQKAGTAQGEQRRQSRNRQSRRRPVSGGKSRKHNVGGAAAAAAAGGGAGKDRDMYVKSMTLDNV